eukprot:CAMPEP_0172441972 /NCGR_PEP_ID=MMETSP1065-20121228/2465_1 /TAXON_ID=265537 /ORGANISM="Amphiprora paludosa, Strain CCMP125" /LENGTH=355 /DNA_ID=CAMNT_0013191611 /DNA_START=72 /DNA_END=1139 /DNA_ORIENTATION=-
MANLSFLQHLPAPGYSAGGPPPMECSCQGNVLPQQETGDNDSQQEGSNSTTSNKKAKQKEQRFIQHEYHDHAQDLPAPGTDPNSCGTDTTTFPVKLYDMLELVDGDGVSQIISWQPHGRCFVIHKPELIDYILPRYFKFSKWSSFQRQLNLYGFKRITVGLDKGGYYHEKFLRGRAFLLCEIYRMRLKGEGHRAKANPAQEPDFWGMPPVQELQFNAASGQQNYPQQNQQQQALPQHDQSNAMACYSSAAQQSAILGEDSRNSFSSSSVVTWSEEQQEQQQQREAQQQQFVSLPAASMAAMEPLPLLEPPSGACANGISIRDLNPPSQQAILEWSRWLFESTNEAPHVSSTAFAV